jgi:LysM repeat protein
MRDLVRILTALTAAILLSSSLFFHPAAAQAGSAYDLINTVNSLRESQGLAPYTIESYLMGYAQAQSDYMASLGTWTHTRADGTTSFDYGIKENVAMGTNMSVSYCVYTVWSDAVHWQTMVGYETGTVGAGVTVVNGSVYYTLDVRPGSSTSSETTIYNNEEPVAYYPQQETTPEYISQVIVNTPDADGIIYHTVQYGETLWSIAIAYNTTIDEILTNSGLPLNTTEVFEGERLLIRGATEPSATPSFTPTEDPGTSTPTQPRPTMTSFPTRTPKPTNTPTPPASLVTRTFGETRYVAIVLISISGIGLMLVIYLGFIKKS